MLLPRALLVPHWPPLLEDELRRHRTPMLEALGREARRFAAERPEIAVVLSARLESNGPFHVGSGRLHRTLTDDPVFGVEFRYDCAGHPGLARALVEAGAAAGVRVGPSERGVDGGVAVPMHFLAPSHGLRVVPLSAARRPAEECRRWGAAIRDVLERRPERIGLVVGGMLSHSTHAWNFRRDVPQATLLDQAVLEALRAGDWEAIRPAADKWLSQAHPEAGLRHLEVLRGFLGADLAGEVLCYESGPGMGAALVAFPVTDAISVAREEDLAEPVAAPASPGRPRFTSKPRTAGKPRFTSRPPSADKPRFTSRPPSVDRPRIASKPRSLDKQRGAIKKNGKRPAFGAGSTGGRKRERDDPRGRGRPRREGASGRPGASAGSRTPRARGRAPASRPARKPPD